MTLTIALTPGYSFAAGEELTAAKLNLLGTPAIALEGEVGSAMLTDNSIETKHLKDEQVTDAKLAQDESNDANRAVGALAIKSGSVVTRCLPNATGVADGATYAKIQHVSATDKVLGRKTAGSGVIEEIACTAYARSLIDDANAATARATLELTYASRPEMETPTTAKRVVAADYAAYHPGMAKAWCQVDGTVAVQFYTAAADAGSDKVTLGAGWYGTMSDGDTLWHENEGNLYGTMAPSTLYFIRKEGSNQVRLYTTKAAAVAGGAGYLNLDTGSGTIRRWETNPILASHNVDGVYPDIGPSELVQGCYDVIFATPFASAAYAYQLSVCEIASFAGRVLVGIAAVEGGQEAGKFGVQTGDLNTTWGASRVFSAVFYGTLAA